MSWISPDFPKAEKLRIIFENDEIAVTHQFMSFKMVMKQFYVHGLLRMVKS